MPTTVPTESDSWLAIGSPQFALRFGRLLSDTRRRSRYSVDDLASSGIGGFGASQLRQYELGSAPIDESIVEALCLVYSADIGRILPARLPLVIDGRRLSCAGVSVGFSPDDPSSLLVSYLRLIRRIRNQKKAPAVALRRDDILVLARYLDIDGAVVVERLSTLMNVTSVQRNTMAMLFATGAIVIGLATGGHASADGNASVDAVTNPTGATHTSDERASGSQRVRSHGSEFVERAVVATTGSVAPAAAVGAGIERGAAAAGLATATRLRVPVASPPSPVAAQGPTLNASGCNPDPSEAVMTVVIPEIAYTCPVYAGGQSMIDAGFVTLVTDAGVNPVLATRPGEPGTLWLAGHRSTNGSAFARVPDLDDGALVTVSSGDTTATYRVVGRTYVEVRGGRVIDASGQATATATWASIIRDDFSGNLAPRLVLQTCEGEDFRWMIYADLVTG